MEHKEKFQQMCGWTPQFKEKEDKADMYLNIHQILHI